MVAMMVLSIMVVGAAGYQLFATQKTLESHYRIQALWIARYMLDHLSSKSELRGLYSTERTLKLEYLIDLDCDLLSCESENQACNIREYQQRIENKLLCLIHQQPYQSLMPEGELSIQCENALPSTDANPILNKCQVEVHWDTPINKILINKQGNNSLILNDWITYYPT